MIYNEKSEYKSWGKLKKQMKDMLCDSLKDKISYFYTTYRSNKNEYGRGSINYLKNEIAANNKIRM